MEQREDSERPVETRKLELDELELIKLDATALRGESETSTERVAPEPPAGVDASALMKLLRENPNLTNESRRRALPRADRQGATMIVGTKPEGERASARPRVVSIKHIVTGFFLFALALVTIVSLLAR